MVDTWAPKLLYRNPLKAYPYTIWVHGSLGEIPWEVKKWQASKLGGEAWAPSRGIPVLRRL